MIKQKKIIGYFLIFTTFLILGQVGNFQTHCQVSANEAAENYSVNDVGNDNINVTDTPENTSEPVPSESPDPGMVEPTATPVPHPADLTGLTVKHDNSGAMLQWMASDGASEYMIYRKSGNDEWSYLTSTQNIFYFDNGISVDQIY
ncbi:MAG: hypothetical protein K2K70_13935, partial [Lachnospiraceae bacterium]|nr:hypothetical protein [Lachnospiraceae bacterium]